MSRILDSGDIDRALKRIAHEIIERNQGISDLLLLGIPTRGAILSERLARVISSIEGGIPSGTLDVTLHRDDLRLRPPRPLSPTSIPSIGIEGKIVGIVADHGKRNYQRPSRNPLEQLPEKHGKRLCHLGKFPCRPHF